MEITFHCIKIKFAKKYWSFGHGPLLRSNICIKSTLNVLYKNKQETSLRSHCTVKQQGAFYEILFIYLNSSLDNITVHDSARKEQIHIHLVVCNFLSRPI